MLVINNILQDEFNLSESQIVNTLKLKSEGATIPFIARYRKEMTGSLDENIIRDIFDRVEYIDDLNDRKKTILESIDSQGKLTEQLKKLIDSCNVKSELEDIYLPYKPKRRTRAMIAIEKGLMPLAEYAKNCNVDRSQVFDLDKEATKYLNEEIESIEDAIKGASDIIAEEIAEIADMRTWVRKYLFNNGKFSSKIKKEFEEGTTKYEAYRDFEIDVKRISAHAMLAMRRAEKEGILSISLKHEADDILNYLQSKQIFSTDQKLIEFYNSVIKDAYSRLMKNTITAEIRLQIKQEADEKSIKIFESNLRQILLAAPAGMKSIFGIDPGFRTGCKIAVLNDTGKYITYSNIFPHSGQSQRIKSEDIVIKLLKKYKPNLLAVGNGTAGRETESFIRDIIKKEKIDVQLVTVNESGASIYSASKIANSEFPELDLTIRGAISIARRLQDPLAELVKIDPKSIGVGQYQHDVDQKLLNKKLDETVESCVNYVGVNLNTASSSLLSHVSGISTSVAENIIQWRNENGKFSSRKELLKVKKFGAKTFEQSAGFLRIRNGNNFLDSTAVHPESYRIVEKIALDIEVDIDQIIDNISVIKKIDLTRFTDDKVGLPTLHDIIDELEKPGRDPRDEFKYAKFLDGVTEMSDLKEGMILEGVITNITAFGAFVDVGVHQDGLIHISELASRFVNDPTKIVKVGETLKVKVLSVDEKLKRISLSRRQALD